MAQILQGLLVVDTKWCVLNELIFFYLNNLFIILKAKVIKQNKPIQNTLSTTIRACRILGMNMMFIVYYLLGLDRRSPKDS